jgi:hypothetical protein
MLSISFNHSSLCFSYCKAMGRLSNETKSKIVALKQAGLSLSDCKAAQCKKIDNSICLAKISADGLCFK